MNYVASSSLIELLASQSKFALGLFLIACGNGFTETTDRAAHVRADATVSETADFALAESFLGAGGIWHVFGSDRVACCPVGDYKKC